MSQNINKYLRKSIAIAFLNKVMAIVIQVYYIPRIAAQMGHEEFAAYGVALALLNWTGILNFGIPSQIIHDLQSQNTSQAETRQHYFSLTVKISSFLILAALLLQVVGIYKIEYKYIEIFSVVLPISAMNIISSSYEGDSNFQLKLHRIQYALFVGYFFTAVILLFKQDVVLSVTMLIMVVFLPVSLLKFSMAIVHYVKLRPALFQKVSILNQIKRINLNFFIIEQLNLAMSHYYPIFILSVKATSEDIVKATFLITIINVILTPQAFLIRPLKGLVAKLGSDQTQKQKLMKLRYLLYVSNISLFIFWMFFGESLIKIWLGDFYPFDEIEITLIGVYFLFYNFEVVTHSVDAYMNDIKPITRAIGIELLVIAVLMPAFGSSFLNGLLILAVSKISVQVYLKVMKNG